MLDERRAEVPVTDWVTPVVHPPLNGTEVHIWKADLDCVPRVLTHLESTLTEEERARAERLVFERDRWRFVAGRGILRTLLGRYLDCRPSAVSFAYNRAGKPRLRGSAPRLRFNISHSQAFAVMGFTLGREIGIDVEAIRSDIAADEIATRFFSPAELDELRAVATDQRVEAFFLCWTRKEAYIKARGEGLGIPLDSFSVSLAPGTPATLRSVDCERWTLRSFRPSPGYAAAVVAESRSRTFSYWTYSNAPRR